jgi:nucleolar GTP-binding protein
LFHSIKPLFANKPLLIIANKTDLRAFDKLTAEEKKLLDTMTSDGISKIIPMSNASEEGITTVVTTACDMLLAHRVEKKLTSKRIDDIRAQIHVAMPVKRDDKVRATAVPATVAIERKAPSGMSLVISCHHHSMPTSISPIVSVMMFTSIFSYFLLQWWLSDDNFA